MEYITSTKTLSANNCWSNKTRNDDDQKHTQEFPTLPRLPQTYQPLRGSLSILWFEETGIEI
jgi:hypothetical protein